MAQGDSLSASAFSESDSVCDEDLRWLAGTSACIIELPALMDALRGMLPRRNLQGLAGQRG